MVVFSDEAHHFMGSGTACAVAQKLGRRWIGVDVNKGAIQVTSKRLQKVIKGKKETKYPIVDEINKRKDEDRNVVVISLGRETKIDARVEDWNKKQPFADTRKGRTKGGSQNH